MSKEDAIPVLSADLIEALDVIYQPLTLPLTAAEWGEMDERVMRQQAFYCGQRALVDMLIEWLRESNEPEGSDDDGDSGGAELDVYETQFGRVLGDSKERPEVASPPMARAVLGAMLDLDPDGPEGS